MTYIHLSKTRSAGGKGISGNQNTIQDGAAFYSLVTSYITYVIRFLIANAELLAFYRIITSIRMCEELRCKLHFSSISQMQRTYCCFATNYTTHLGIQTSWYT
jgi:hypothetical protein